MCPERNFILVCFVSVALSIICIGDIECSANQKRLDTSNQSLRQGLNLRLEAVKPNISPDSSAEIVVRLINVSQDPLWVEKRLVLGHHVDLFVINREGSVVKLAYPAFTLALPSRNDFAQLQPGESMAKTFRVTNNMLPEFARKPGGWTFVVRVCALESGENIGINSWKGVMKSYVKLSVR